MKYYKLLFLFFSVVFFSFSLSAKTFKCWTNEEGIRECGNSLPPQYVKQRIEFLNEKSGKLSKFTPAAKTPQQIEAEKAQIKAQEKQQKEQERQKRYDDVLLKTYLSIDDLLLSLQWKITTLDSRISVTKGSIRAENIKFMHYTKQAAKMERSGRQLSADIKNELKVSRHRVKNLNLRIKALKKDKKDIHEKFSHDVDRFTIATINGLTLTLRDEMKAQKLQMIQLSCKQKTQCDTMWSTAKKFISNNTDLAIIFDTAQVRTTVSTKNAKQMAYTVSRASSFFDNKKSEKITLKIRCHPTREGRQLCNSPKMVAQLKAFKNLVSKHASKK